MAIIKRHLWVLTREEIKKIEEDMERIRRKARAHKRYLELGWDKKIPELEKEKTMSSTSRDIAGALNFRSGLIPYANDAAANQATEAELRRTIKFPPEHAPGRAINTAMSNGGAGSELKQTSQAKHYNTTTKDFPEHGHDSFESAGAVRLKFGDVTIERKGDKFVVKGKEY